MSSRSCGSGSGGSRGAARACAAALACVIAATAAIAQNRAEEDVRAQIRALDAKVDLLLKQNQLLLKRISPGDPNAATESATDAPWSRGQLAELQEQIQDLKDQLDRIYAQLTIARTNVAVVTASGTPAPVRVAPGVDYVHDEDQYVRVRVTDAHQQWEVRVDPAYADLNVVLVRSTDALFGVDPALERRTLNELADFVKDQLKAGQRGRREESIRPGVLEDLHRAQKLFYSRKYLDALVAVQRSLAAQKTALGYALEGSIHFTLGDAAAAVTSWERALEINPDMDEVRAMLALVRRSAAPAAEPSVR